MKNLKTYIVSSVMFISMHAHAGLFGSSDVHVGPIKFTVNYSAGKSAHDVKRISAGTFGYKYSAPAVKLSTGNLTRLIVFEGPDGEHDYKSALSFIGSLTNGTVISVTELTKNDKLRRSDLENICVSYKTMAKKLDGSDDWELVTTTLLLSSFANMNHGRGDYTFDPRKPECELD